MAETTKHDPEHRCFYCATDAELSRALNGPDSRTMSDSVISLTDDPNRLLTQQETAALLRLKSDRTLRNWAANGRGPRRIQDGAFVRYRAGDVAAWLEQA
jgi:predicted DNA-binding transcriptional regulator AlpA